MLSNDLIQVLRLEELVFSEVFRLVRGKEGEREVFVGFLGRLHHLFQ